MSRFQTKLNQEREKQGAAALEHLLGKKRKSKKHKTLDQALSAAMPSIRKATLELMNKPTRYFLKSYATGGESIQPMQRAQQRNSKYGPRKNQKLWWQVRVTDNKVYVVSQPWRPLYIPYSYKFNVYFSKQEALKRVTAIRKLLGTKL